MLAVACWNSNRLTITSSALHVRQKMGRMVFERYIWLLWQYVGDHNH